MCYSSASAPSPLEAMARCEEPSDRDIRWGKPVSAGAKKRKAEDIIMELDAKMQCVN